MADLCVRLQDAVRDAILYRDSLPEIKEKQLITEYEQVQQGLKTLSDHERRKLAMRLSEPQTKNRLSLVPGELDDYNLRKLDWWDVFAIKKTLQYSNQYGANAGFFKDGHGNLTKVASLQGTLQSRGD